MSTCTDYGAGLLNKPETLKHLDFIIRECVMLMPDGGYWNDKIGTVLRLLKEMRADCEGETGEVTLPDGTSFPWPKS